MIRLLWLRWRRAVWFRHEETLRAHMAGYSAALSAAAVHRRKIEAELAIAELQRGRVVVR